jgi:hypothetical protein
MSEARTVWHAMEARRNTAASRQRSGILLAICLVCAMAAAEVLFLRFVAGPDSVNMMVAAEGVAIPQ